VDEAEKRLDIVNNQQELEYFDSPQVRLRFCDAVTKKISFLFQPQL